MIKLEDVIDFRSQKQPVMTLWQIGDLQAYGSLTWEVNQPKLTLVIEAEAEPFADKDIAQIPLLVITKPPAQPNIIGKVRKFGTITLEHCPRTEVSTSYDIEKKRAIFELTLMPTAVWMGVPKEAVEGQISQVCVSDTRLSGFFEAPNAKSYFRFDNGMTNVFEGLNNPSRILAIEGPNEHKIEIGDTGWLLSLHTDTMEETSATNGHLLRSSVKLTIHSTNPTTIEESSKIVWKIEELISTFSIEPFNFEYEKYMTNKSECAVLAWRFGMDSSAFRPPMRHQVLIDFGDRDTLKNAFFQWFTGSPTLNLSRWLFVRALRETENGLARFIAVAQAFEVLGREFGPSSNISKTKLDKAIKLVSEALASEFEADFISRTIGLIRSSNRASYRDVLYHMLSGAVERLHLGTDDEVRKLSKNISDTRNSIIHMADDKQGKLQSAFDRVNKLSYQLCFWYAVCQADQMNLKVPDVGRFLYNNRNARSGLPNEALAKR